MNLFRPDVARIEGYVPGEQPHDAGWIKLNTNENPYPPSPRVIEAIEAAARGRLNVYPDPLANKFRQLAADRLGVEPDWILPANGSDENLTILMRTFVDPGELVSYPYPSYILYETLAELQSARHERIKLNADWSWNHAAATPIVAQSKLVFVPNPNSPSGNLWPAEDIRKLIPDSGILVVDQAYGDFSDESAIQQLLNGDKSKQVVITRTLSKSFSLAGIRFGFAIADPELIAGMRKVKDSYNCNALSLAAAVAAFEDFDWMTDNVDKIRRTRGRLCTELIGLGFQVVDSQTNFVWATLNEPDQLSHREIFDLLKEQRILVRFMQFPDAVADDKRDIDGLRITVGTDAEIDQFVTVLSIIMSRNE